MSIEDLQTEFERIEKIVAEPPRGGEAEAAWALLRDSVVPFLSLLVEEIGEMDEAIEEAYHDMPDALHTENAKVFAGIIASGTVLSQELRKRVGNDRRLIDLIKEWNQIAAQGREILEEITVPDTIPDQADTLEAGEETEPPPAAAEGGA